MFADACERAWKFTGPVVVVFHCMDGECRSSVGSLVVVNKEGWFLSAWHMQKLLQDLAATKTAVAQYHSQKAAIEQKKGLSHRERKQALKGLQAPGGEVPADWAVWWAGDSVQAVDVVGIPEADVMLGRLQPFDPNSVTEYPSFKDPDTPIRQGTSLCRLGYPFPMVKAAYDATRSHFDLSQMDLPGFAIEGILTRQLKVGQNAQGYMHGFVETSSPGLKGQSGGPIVDVHGTVWGIQSQTQHLSLGFDPEVPADPKNPKGSGKKEHQFLNVGWGTHPATIVGLLREKGIAHRLTS